MTCDSCRKPRLQTSTSVLNGKFGHYCANCINGYARLSLGANAQYNRDRDREEHLADLVQPWDRNGNPNPEFIRLYPKEAKLNFSQNEIEKFG